MGPFLLLLVLVVPYVLWQVTTPQVRSAFFAAIKPHLWFAALVLLVLVAAAVIATSGASVRLL